MSKKFLNAHARQWFLMIFGLFAMVFPLKSNFRKITHIAVLIAILVGTISAGTLINPNVAHASCDPATQQQDYQAPTVSISQPTGSYTDPGSMSIAISGQLAYYCEGFVGGGAGYQNTATSVNYQITNDSNGSMLFSNTWNSPSCPNPLACLPGPYNISDTANASLWGTASYTITASVYDNTQHSAGNPNPIATSFNHFTVTRTAAVGYEIQGSLAIQSVTPDPSDTSINVSGTGTGGYWSRGGPRCFFGSNRSEAFIRMQLVTTTPANGPYPPGSDSITNNSYHNPPPSSYSTIYKIDGSTAGTYPLVLTYSGSDVPGDPNCNTTPDPMGYSFNFSINTTGLTNGQHTVTVTAWDESKKMVVSSTYTFTVSHPVVLTPDWSVSCTPASVTLTQGNSGSYSLSTSPINGFKSAVTFSGPSYSPNPGVAPSVSFSNNSQAPSATTTAIINTTASTSPGTYTLTFTGTDGLNTHTCSVQLIVQALPSPTVVLSFSSSSTVTTQTIASGASTTIYWTPTNTTAGTNCTASNAWSGAQGSNSGQQYSYATPSMSSFGSPYTFSIQCTGPGGTTSLTSIVLTVSASPDFSLSCTPSSLTLTQGNSGSYSLTTTPLNGYTAKVTFSGPSYSPTPGVAPSISFSNNTQIPSATTTALVTTTTSTSPGTYNLTFTGTGSGATHNCSVQLIVTAVATPAVELSFSPHPSVITTQTISAGSSATLYWYPTNTTAGTNCTASNAWGGALGSNPGQQYSQSTGAMPAGTYTYTIQCTGPGGSTSPASVTLTVSSAPVPDWSISCTPASITITQGNSGSYSLSTSPINGFASAVTFSGPSYSPSPGVAPSISFSNNGQVPSATTTAIVTTTGSTSAGTYTLTFTGTGGSITHTCSVQLIVQAVSVTASVDIKCNGTDGPCPVASGGSATLSWTSSNCTGISIDQGIGGVAATGTTPTGSTFSTKTFIITCTAVSGDVTDSVTITVNPADWSLSCTPASITVPQGNSGSYSLSTSPINGFSSGVTFSGPSYSPTPGNAPGISFFSNGQVPSATTTAFVTTSALTTAGTYTLTFTGTGGGITHTCSVQLIVQTVAVTSGIDLKCNGTDGPCTVISGGSATLSWVPTNCSGTLDMEPGGMTLANSPGSMSTGPLFSSRNYFLSCFDGSGGSYSDSVTVNVGVDWSLSCSPSAGTVSPGGSTSFSLSTSPVGAFGGAITFSGPTYSPTPGVAPSVSFTNNNQLTPATTTAIISTTGSTSTGVYNITFTGVMTGSGGMFPHSCTVQLTIGSAPPPSDWTLSCTPPSASIMAGNSTSFSLSTTPVSGFNKAVTFSAPTYFPTPSTPPSVSFSGNSQVPSAVTTAIITTTSSTSTGTYTLQFNGVGNGITHICSVSLTISGGQPATPINVTTSNFPCGTVTVSWAPGTPSTPAPSGYRVFRGTSSNPSFGTWTLISKPTKTDPDPLPPTQTSWQDTSPGYSSNYYKVLAYNGLTASNDPGTATLGNAAACAGALTSSDIDLTQVSGKINKTFSAISCNGTSDVATLPNNALFTVGDRVTFKLNVCNSGSAGLTSVSVSNPLTNITSPTVATASPSGCVTGQSYNVLSNTFTFNLADLPSGGGSTQVCSITYTATVTAPASAPGSVYRFLSAATIYSTELGSYPITTPPYLFGNTSTVPDRTETAPQ